MVVLNWSWVRIVIIMNDPGSTVQAGGGSTLNDALPLAVVNVPWRGPFGSRNPFGFRTRRLYSSKPGTTAWISSRIRSYDRASVSQGTVLLSPSVASARLATIDG